ncbi:putative squalene monooxygenase, partial [Lachnellula suecica]
LIYQIGTHETRILIDVPDNIYEGASKNGGVKNYIREKVISTLPDSVQPMVEVALQEGRLRSMPNSWLPPDLNKTAGIVLLGDAMNMRHPLIGGGMTVGLNDVALVSELLNPQNMPSLQDSDAVFKQIKTFHSRRKAYSMTLNVLAQALYSLFVADDPQLRVLQRGFVQYIKRGGACIDEPAGLLGGVINNPWLLFYHFFAVAVCSLRILVVDRYSTSIWYLPSAIIECVRVFVKACQVILPFVFLELMA